MESRWLNRFAENRPPAQKACLSAKARTHLKEFSGTTEEAAEKCHPQLHNRAPAAKAGPIFHRVTVCLKAYPDTNRSFSATCEVVPFPNRLAGRGRPAYVGFDELQCDRVAGWLRPLILDPFIPKINVNSGGQECPPFA